jgi:hypothetical protein
MDELLYAAADVTLSPSPLKNGDTDRGEDADDGVAVPQSYRRPPRVNVKIYNWWNQILT